MTRISGSNSPSVSRPKSEPPKSKPKTESSPQKTESKALSENTTKKDNFVRQETERHLLTRSTSTARRNTVNDRSYESYNKETTSPLQPTEREYMRRSVETDGSKREVNLRYQGDQLREKTSERLNVSDNLTQSTKTSERYNRQGNVNYHAVSDKLMQNYQFEDHKATITSEKTNVQTAAGEYNTEANSYVRTQGRNVTTQSQTTESGQKLEFSREGAKLEDGSLSLGNYGVDYSNNHSKTQNTYERTHDLRSDRPAVGSLEEKEAQATLERQRATANDINQGLNVLEEMGLKKDLISEESTTTLNEGVNLYQGTTADGHGSLEVKAGEVTTTSQEEMSIGASGLNYSRSQSIDASVLSANAQYENEGDFGKVEAEADVSVLSAGAGYEGSAHIGPMGAELQGSANASVALIEANVSGKYTTPGVTVGGEEFTAGVEANGSAFVGAEAEVNGSVTASIYPPEAAVNVGGEAFAGAKLEGDVSAHAGPFSVTASGSLNAGAGVEGGLNVGLEDGKLKFGANLGATLGIGASGNVNVEVDVGQIARAGVGLAQEAGEAVHDALDATGDGQLGLDDAAAIGNAVVDTVGDTVSDTVDSIGEGLSDAGSAVKNFFGW